MPSLSVPLNRSESIYGNGAKNSTVYGYIKKSVQTFTKSETWSLKKLELSVVTPGHVRQLVGIVCIVHLAFLCLLSDSSVLPTKSQASHLYLFPECLFSLCSVKHCLVPTFAFFVYIIRIHVCYNSYFLF